MPSQRCHHLTTPSALLAAFTSAGAWRVVVFGARPSRLLVAGPHASSSRAHSGSHRSARNGARCYVLQPSRDRLPALPRKSGSTRAWRGPARVVALFQTGPTRSRRGRAVPGPRASSRLSLSLPFSCCLQYPQMVVPPISPFLRHQRSPSLAGSPTMRRQSVSNNSSWQPQPGSVPNSPRQDRDRVPLVALASGMSRSHSIPSRLTETWSPSVTDSAGLNADEPDTSRRLSWATEGKLRWAKVRTLGLGWIAHADC